jgi:hypothetical protein
MKKALTPAGPRMPPFHSDRNVSPESTNPNDMAMSPNPFSLFSSSSRSLKLRGTMTTSPAGVLCMAEFEMVELSERTAKTDVEDAEVAMKMDYSSFLLLLASPDIASVGNFIVR